MILTKTVKKYGNSGGIYVPRNWVGGTVRIELVEEPSDPLADIMKKLPSQHIVSVITYGSHARNDASPESDIDILVVMDNDATLEAPKELKNRYDIQVRKEEEVRRAAEKDPVFFKAMAEEAVALVNHAFLDELKKTKPGKDSVRTRLELAESSLSIVKELMKLPGDNRNLVYPLMLRFKEAVWLQYFLENKKYSLKAMENEAAAFGISRKELNMLMTIYRAKRDDKPGPGIKIPDTSVEKLVLALEEKIRHVKKKAHQERS